jgi:hypothetical protein
MRIAANLPHDLWNEIVKSTVYLRDQTLRESNGWKSPYAFYVKYPVKTDIQDTNQDATQAGDAFNTLGVFNDSVKDLFKEAYDNRFEDFIEEKITSTYHGAFLAGRKFNLDNRLNDSKLKSGRTRNVRLHRKNLPPPPQSIRDLNTHPLREHFQKAQRDHLQSHHQMRSFQETDKKHTKEITIF